MPRGIYVRTPEHCAKMSKAHMGNKVSAEQIEKMRKSRWTPERRKAQSEFMMGNKYTLGYKHTDEWKKSHSEFMKGHKYSFETLRKMSESHLARRYK